MSKYSFKQSKHCRWCGIQYYAIKPHDRDGFHSPACKQAHHRAYKKYVMAKPISERAQQIRPVTQKKCKKSKK